jgi:1,4-dihydroxy-2-naphthoate polyprenyltransferase
MGRPLFLIGIIPLYTLGIAAVWQNEKAIRVSLVLPGFFLVWLIQLMTHYNNEFSDLETDIATETPTRISGGSRALVKRLVPRTVARQAALTSLLLAIILVTIMVVILGAGPWIWGLTGAAAFLGWFYSGKPLKLESTGAGEITNVIVSCFLLPISSCYLQSSNINSGLLLACVPPGLLALALILTTEIPDVQGDRATGKRTLVVRLGTTRAVRLIGAALGTGWLAFSGVMVYLGPFWGWILVIVSLPLLAIIGLYLKSTDRQGPVNLERIGLLISLLLGYASISLNLAFFLK